MNRPGEISQSAAAHLEMAIRAAQEGDLARAVGALVSIDADSWDAALARLAQVGLADVVTGTVVRH